MPKKRDAPVVESGEGEEEITPIETWTLSEGATEPGEGPPSEAVISEASINQPELKEEVKVVETWTMLLEDSWVPSPEELWPPPPGGVPEVGADSELALEAHRNRL